jgi:RpiB/LacA/LacB family sugar-phosphate isomerase
MNIKLSFASDHAGFEMKERIIDEIKESFYLINRGTFSGEQVDYCEYAVRVAEDITNEYANFGVLICGTGIGMSIVANRFPQVRACNPIKIEQVILAREHNDANVICFGARLSTFEEIMTMLDKFIKTQFTFGRHEERVKKLSMINYNFANRFAEEF